MTVLLSSSPPERETLNYPLKSLTNLNRTSRDLLRTRQHEYEVLWLSIVALWLNTTIAFLNFRTLACSLIRGIIDLDIGFDSMSSLHLCFYFIKYWLALYSALFVTFRAPLQLLC